MAALPYGRQLIEEDDVAAVRDVLMGDWLTTGPAVEVFEAALAEKVGAAHAVVCNSGTAALYIAVRALGLGPGDTAIVPTVTFLATASACVLAGLDVVFADVEPETGMMGVQEAEAALARAGGRARAILPVHLGGQVADPPALKAFADTHGLRVIEDACHAFGTRYGDKDAPVGACAHSDVACFSFHPVKAIAMGEGGAVTTNDHSLQVAARSLRNHGMSRDAGSFTNRNLARSAGDGVNPWYYEAALISHNFRASDINCALGLSQLKKVDRFLARRRELVALYWEKLRPLAPQVRPAPQTGGPHGEIGWHLFRVLMDFAALDTDRRTVMTRLKAEGVGTQVHYIPVHLQPFYRERFPSPELPGAVSYYGRTLSLPLFPGMDDADVDRVVGALKDALGP